MILMVVYKLIDFCMFWLDSQVVSKLTNYGGISEEKKLRFAVSIEKIFSREIQ